MEYDVLIFGGQSNMQGQTGSFPTYNKPVEGAVEYRFLTDSFIPVQHPIGEVIEGGLLLAASGNNGSMVPACCREYVKKTGRSVLAIHVARGNTAIAEWDGATRRYQLAVEKIQGGLNKLRAEGHTVGKIYYLWLQGESDAINGTTTEDYERMLIDLKNNLKRDAGIHKFCILKVGYFNRHRAKALAHLTVQQRAAYDENIMHAQELAAQHDEDVVMLLRILPEMSLDQKNINPKAMGHFNNKAHTVIGKAAANALAKL